MPHLRYEQHTWEELRELGRRDDVVVVIPTATLEDHGYHLPIDTDVRLAEAVARGRVRARERGGRGPRRCSSRPRCTATRRTTSTSRAPSRCAGTSSSSTCSTSGARSAGTASTGSCSSTGTARTSRSSRWRRAS